MKRIDYAPLLEPRAVYEALKRLYLGDAIPPEVYVSDWQDGKIPDWRIHYRETLGRSVLLVVFDMDNTYRPGGQPATQMSLFDNDVRYPAVRIISGLDAWPNMMCDMLQQAKIAVKSEAKR